MNREDRRLFRNDDHCDKGMTVDGRPHRGHHSAISYLNANQERSYLLQDTSYALFAFCAAPTWQSTVYSSARYVEICAGESIVEGPGASLLVPDVSVAD